MLQHALGFLKTLFLLLYITGFEAWQVMLFETFETLCTELINVMLAVILFH